MSISCDKRQTLRLALAEKSSHHRDIFLPSGWSGLLCMSFTAIFDNQGIPFRKLRRARMLCHMFVICYLNLYVVIVCVCVSPSEEEYASELHASTSPRAAGEKNT